MNIETIKFFCDHSSYCDFTYSHFLYFFNEYFINRVKDSILFISFFIISLIDIFIGDSFSIKLLFITMANLVVSFIFLMELHIRKYFML